MSGPRDRGQPARTTNTGGLPLSVSARDTPGSAVPFAARTTSGDSHENARHHPDVPRGREHRRRARPGPRRRAARRHPRRRRRQPRRHRRPGPRPARRARPGRGAGPPGKGGLGGAYRAGFQHAFADGYEVVVQMDADLSHPPDRLPALLAEVDEGADIAIGSRYVPGGATANWPLVAQAAVARRQPLRLDCARPRRARRHRRVPGLPGRHPADRRGRAPPRPPATASSSSCPTGPTASAPRSSRCRSPSTTGSGACRRCRGTSSARRCRW